MHYPLLRVLNEEHKKTQQNLCFSFQIQILVKKNVHLPRNTSCEYSSWEESKVAYNEYHRPHFYTDAFSLNSSQVFPAKWIQCLVFIHSNESNIHPLV